MHETRSGWRRALGYPFVRWAVALYLVVALIAVGSVLFSYDIAWAIRALALTGLIVPFLLFRHMMAVQDPVARRREQDRIQREAGADPEHDGT